MVLSDGRRAGFCWGEKPRCLNQHPRAHRLGLKQAVLTEAIVTCHHRAERGGSECDTLQYVRRWARTPDEAPCWFVVEITKEHVRRLTQGPMLFLETMTILGCVLPGVDLDVGISAFNDVPCARCGRSRARHAAADHEYEPAV